MMWDQKICNCRGFGATPIVFVLVPLISLGGFLLFSALRGAHAPEITPVAIQKQSAQENTSLDSDQDGLKDWEEQIYATDTHNPDSDGDGAKDGDEITQGRDPLKKGPNDMLTKIDASAAIVADSNAYTGDQFNLTRKIAEVFGTDYLTNLVQNPQSQPDMDAIADKMAQIALEQPPSRTPPITANDIIISRNVTVDDIMRYVKQFNTIILNPLKPLPDIKSISTAITNIIHTQDAARASTAADQLLTYVNNYNQFLIDIRTISVPKKFVSLHVDYLNTAIKERDALKKIQNIKNDPAATLVGFQELMDTTTKFNDLQNKYAELLLGTSTRITHQ